MGPDSGMPEKPSDARMTLACVLILPCDISTPAVVICRSFSTSVEAKIDAVAEPGGSRYCSLHVSDARLSDYHAGIHAPVACSVPFC